MELPEEYTDIKPISSLNRKPKHRDYPSVLKTSNDLDTVLLEEEKYIFSFTVICTYAKKYYI